jgi:hypothetical protein
VSGQQQQRRIPKGTIIAEIPLEAAKAFPTRIFAGTEIYPPRIAYADLNTHGEKNVLIVKLLPDGAKTAPHPQIVFALKGPYHVEELSYNSTEPFDWTTWQEYHFDAKNVDDFIFALLKVKMMLEEKQ